MQFPIIIGLMLVIIVTSLILGTTELELEHYQNPATMDSEQLQFFPFSNPFKPKFYKDKHEIYQVYVDNYELHRPLLNNVMESYALNTDNEMGTNALHNLNNYTTDFVLDTELNIAPRYLGTAQPNIRFVCSLYSPALLLLSPNNSNIIDMGDLKHWSCKVKIAVNRSSNYQAIMALLAQYESDNAEIIPVTSDNLMKGYGTEYQVYADLAMSYDEIISKLTQKVPSHLVSMRNINGGEYHITLSEQAFYRNYPYYEKDMIELKTLQQYYPQLAQVHNRDLYYPTIKTKYVLLCHDRIRSKPLSTIVHKILVLMHQHWPAGHKITTLGQQERRIVNQLFKGTTVTDITHISTTIPIHDSVKEIYRKLQLHSLDDNSYYMSSSGSNSISP